MTNVEGAATGGGAAASEREPTFEVGLVLAGAVSAGAYSAGVIDFIVEALDAYEIARRTGVTPEGEPWTGPTHAVRVPVMAGASAGGMTAAMAALQLHTDFEHLGPGRAPTKPEYNRLYASWVDEIDIEPLLDTRDLRAGRLRSVLSCSVLDEIMGRTLALAPSTTRNWVGRGASQALAVILTVSDTAGVPYQFRMAGPEGESDYAMLNHGATMRFLVGRDPIRLDEHVDFEVLDLARPAPDMKALFGQAALATGAFPIGLAPRVLRRRFDDYEKSTQVGFDRIMPDRSIVFTSTPPMKVPAGRIGVHEYVAVDGGVIDNEPLESARRFLRPDGQPKPRNQDGAETSYAVVLIDPFPNRAVWPDEPKEDAALLSPVALNLLGMLIDQARFKPQELTLALNETVFSRFAILPRPDVPTPDARKLPIACGALGGFSGFLHRSFRHHDYCLGRRNAQAFLASAFCLPETNPLFDAWKAKGGQPASWYVPEAAGGPGAATLKTVAVAVPTESVPNPETRRALPIIPLTPRLRREITLGAQDRPRPGNVDRARLDALINARFTAVTQRFVDDEIRDLVPVGWLGRPLLKQFLPGVLRNKAMKSVDQALDDIHKAFPG